MNFARNYAKRRKLAGFGEIPDKHVKTILDESRRDPRLAENVTKRTLCKARKELAKEVGATISVGGIRLPTIDFARGLLAIAKTEPWSEAIMAAYARRPCVDADTAWRIVVYGDEVTPGNILRLDHRRKALCMYITFVEFDYEYIASADLWLPLGICRSSLAKKIDGGYSHFARMLLRDVLERSGATEHGVLLKLHGGTVVRIYAKGGAALFDGDAFRLIWGVKGSGGVLPCILCKNVTTTAEMIRPGGPFVGIDEPSSRKLQFASSAEIYRKADQLSVLHGDYIAGLISKKDFEEAEINRGIVYNPHGLLYDAVPRNRFPIGEVAWYDSMHNLVARGIVQAETAWLLRRLEEHGFTFADLRRFAGASNWRVIRIYGWTKFRSLFSAARELHFKRNHVYNPDAGDMLMAMPLILHFANSVAGHLPDMDLPLRSYRALRDVVLLCHRSKFDGTLADQLCSAVETHLRLRNAAYPGLAAKPKHHFNHHLGPQMRKLGGAGKLLDCFVGERKNCSLRASANIVRNGKAWEWSVLFRALGAQLRRLQNRTPIDALHAPVAVSPCGTVQSSQTAMFHGVRLGKGDAMRVGKYVLMLRQFEFDDVNGFRVCCDATEFREQVNSHAAAWVCTSESARAKVGSFQLVSVYYPRRDGRIVVLD